MQKILLISGCKQSGKSSAANYLAGYLLHQSGLSINGTPVSMFQLNEKGALEFDSYFVNPTTKEKEGEWAEVDVSRKDPEFTQVAEQLIWPVIKLESFAEAIKEICVYVFALKREEVYGDEEQKNRLSGIKWENVYKLLPGLKPTEGKGKKKAEPPEFLTNREVMQVFGTDICRALYNECWIQSLFTRVLGEDYPFVVISDCRYKDEIEFARQLGVDVKVVRLTRNPYKDQHSGETELIGYEGFDFVIDNENISQEEKGLALVNYLRSIGWIV